MNIDALKAAMSSLDGHGDQPAPTRMTATRKARGEVSSLANWQIVQIATGLTVAVAGGSVWSGMTAQPGLLFACGLIVHLYGIAMIALGVAARVHAARIDMSAPVVETEARMARLRQIMLVSGWLLGASWWALWLPFTAVAVRLLFGADMLAAVGVGTWFAVTTVTGLACWSGMWLLHRWAVRTDHALLASPLDDMMTGRGFREAQRHLGEVARFTAE